MKTNILYVLYTYNRKHILQKCWESLFANNILRPDRVLILDDCSEQEVQNGLFNAHFLRDIPIDLFLMGKNVGYGRLAEKAFSLIDTYDPNYVFFIETDYLFADKGLDKVMDIFQNNQYGKEAVACSGYSNPDFKNLEKIANFPKINLEEFGEDNVNRDILYKPFKQNTKYGEIDFQFVSNSCGTIYINWQMLKKIRSCFEDEYNIWVNKTVQKYNTTRNLSDGALSSGLCWLWNKYAEVGHVDRNKYSAIFDINPSVASHYNGGGMNAGSYPEGTSFVHSDSWTGPKYFELKK